MRILFTGDSTPGDLSPIIAVYESLQKKWVPKKKGESLECLFMGMENDLLKTYLHQTNIQFFSLGKRDNEWKSNISTSVLLFIKVLWPMFDYMPDVIFSKGGFVSLPIMLVGRIFNIPVIMHESDIFPSTWNVRASWFAKKIAVSYDKTLDFYNNTKTVVTGSPVSAAVAQGDRAESKKRLLINSDKPVLFIMSGGKGATQINKLILEVLPVLLEKYEIIHQCGMSDYNQMNTRVAKMNVPNLEHYHLFPFLKKSIAHAYAAADLVISRAGSTAVAEIIFIGKPSILIPLSVTESSSQIDNAFYYSEAGAALMLNEKNLKPSLFLNAINGLFGNKLKVLNMMRAAKKLSRPEASDLLAEEIIKLVK